MKTYAMSLRALTRSETVLKDTFKNRCRLPDRWFGMSRSSFSIISIVLSSNLRCKCWEISIHRFGSDTSR